MAGIEKSPSALRAEILAWLGETENDALGMVEDTALEASIAGEEMIRKTIDITPSDLSRNPKGNRNWTYHMRNRVDSKVSRTGNTITIQMGWMGVKSDERYIGIQEYGGNVHGKTVSAMGSLTAGRSEALRILKNKGLI